MLAKCRCSHRKDLGSSSYYNIAMWCDRKIDNVSDSIIRDSVWIEGNDPFPIISTDRLWNARFSLGVGDSPA